MQHEASTTPVLPPVHAETHVGRRCATTLQPRFHFIANADSISYDTRCYFNVRSKADISQLNLPHGTKTIKLTAEASNDCQWPAKECRSVLPR